MVKAVFHGGSLDGSDDRQYPYDPFEIEFPARGELYRRAGVVTVDDEIVEAHYDLVTEQERLDRVRKYAEGLAAVPPMTLDSDEVADELLFIVGRKQ